MKLKNVQKSMTKILWVSACVILVVACVFLLQSCQKEKTPVVSTGAVSAITGTTATCGGSIEDNGAAVTVRGVCYNTIGHPSIDDPHTTDGSGCGDFRSYMTGLQPNTTYYVRAYAGNSSGVTYGNEVSFTTTEGGDPVDPEIPKTPTELLTIPRGWRLSAAECTPAYQLENGIFISNLLDGWFCDLELDDIIVFYANGTHIVWPGNMIDGEFGYQVETNLGEWHFDNPTNPTLLFMQIPFFYNENYTAPDPNIESCSLLELSNDKLKISYTFNETKSKRTYTFTLTYEPA